MKDYKVVKSPEVTDEEYPEIHFHNGVDQPELTIADIPTGLDHVLLSNVTIDQHHARDHASRHLSGGGDTLTLTAVEVPTNAWAAHIIPALDSSYDLGSTTKAWANFYVDTIKSITGNVLTFTPIAGSNALVSVSGAGNFSVADTFLVNPSGGIAEYKNVTTAGWGVPSVYAAGRSTAQIAAVASVATYTVGADDGSFCVSANVLVTTSTTHNFTVTCTYTDEGNTARTLTLNFSVVGGTIATAIANAGGAVPYHGIPLHIRCKSSTAITIATTGTFTTVTYNVEGVIQQIA